MSLAMNIRRTMSLAMMENTLLLVALVIGSWRWCHAQTEVTMRVPRTMDDCYAQAMVHPIDPKSAKVDCLQRLMWFYEPNQNLTREALSYFGTLKGSAMGDPAPKTGFRTRKEYRRLTDMERSKLHDAFNKLYKKGILRRYADLHRNAIDTARDGAAFLAWHRVFLAMFEDELRHVEPNVSLPYWDSSLDFYMDNGVNSVIWSLKFLGNANGEVNTGPFAGWITSRGRLWRRYGNDGILISRENIAKIMSRCQTSDIMIPLHPPSNFSTLEYILEFHSNGVHKWVGGDMADGHFAGYDPLFYMHQAYIDYLWEYFRYRQKTVCGINPETAYANPPYRSGQAPDDLMSGFTEFKNIDGLKEYWTRTWYDYEVVSECPNCGSKYLHCDKAVDHCISHSRRTDFNSGRYLESPTSPEFGIPTEPFEPLSIVIPKRLVYNPLPSPTNDHRTRRTARRDAKMAVLMTPLPVGGPPSPQRQNPGPTPTIIRTWVHNLQTPSPPPSTRGGHLPTYPKPAGTATPTPAAVYATRPPAKYPVSPPPPSIPKREPLVSPSPVSRDALPRPQGSPFAQSRYHSGGPIRQNITRTHRAQGHPMVPVGRGTMSRTTRKRPMRDQRQKTLSFV